MNHLHLSNQRFDSVVRRPTDENMPRRRSSNHHRKPGNVETRPSRFRKSDAPVLTASFPSFLFSVSFPSCVSLTVIDRGHGDASPSKAVIRENAPEKTTEFNTAAEKLFLTSPRLKTVSTVNTGWEKDSKAFGWDVKCHSYGLISQEPSPPSLASLVRRTLRSWSMP